MKKETKTKIFLIFLTMVIAQIIILERRDKKFGISSDIYENILPISQGKDFLKKEGRYIFRNGDRAIETEYRELKQISENYFQARDEKGREFLIRENREISLPEHDEILEISEERYALLRKDSGSFYYDLLNGNYIGERYERLGAFHEGRAYFLKDDKLGFIDTEGREVIENQFSATGNFRGGYAIVADGRYRYITKDGEISPEEYDVIKILEDGEMIMKAGNHTILQTERDRIRVQGEILHLTRGSYLFQNGGENRVYSSKERDFVKTLEGEYLGVADGKILSEKDGRIAVYDIGSRESKSLPEQIKIVDLYREDQIVAREIEGGKAFLFNENGEKISRGYDLIYPKSYDKIIVGDENGYGVIDRRGRKILDCQFESIQLTPDFIIAEQNGKKTLYIGDEKKAIPDDYREIVYTKGNTYVKDDGGWRYIYQIKPL